MNSVEPVLLQTKSPASTWFHVSCLLYYINNKVHLLFSSCLSCYSETTAAFFSTLSGISALSPSIRDLQGTEKLGYCQPETLMLSAVLFLLQEQNNDLVFLQATLILTMCVFYAVHLLLMQIFFMVFLALWIHQRTTSGIAYDLSINCMYGMTSNYHKENNHQHKQKAIIFFIAEQIHCISRLNTHMMAHMASRVQVISL